MTRADKILLAALLMASLLTGAALYGRAFLSTGPAEPVQAIVTVQGKVVRSVELLPGQRSTLVVQGRRGAATVEFDGRRVRMLEAHCENGTCLKQGWIEHAGQSIVCVPGEIVVRMEGEAPLDAVTR